MATAVAGILGSGGRLGTLRGYPLLRVRPRVTHGLVRWSGRGPGRSGIWSCTNHEIIGGPLEEGKRQEVLKPVGSGESQEVGDRRSLRIQHIVRGRVQQVRCLSIQGNNNGKPPEEKTYIPPPNDTTHNQLTYPTPSSLTLHENIYTLPNLLTTTRLLCAPLIGYLLLHYSYPYALTLFIYAGITDLVDGWIARRYNSGTVVGTVLDPMADKALMTVVVGVLGWQHILPLPLAVLILGRDVLLSLTAFYYRYVSLPPPRTLARYWDFSLPSAEVKPTGISKVNTFLQLGLIGATMTGLAFPGLVSETAQSALELSWWVVGGTTVWSGASYLGKGGVRVLGKKGA